MIYGNVYSQAGKAGNCPESSQFSAKQLVCGNLINCNLIWEYEDMHSKINIGCIIRSIIEKGSIYQKLV